MTEPEWTPEERAEHVYDLFQRGTALLEAKDFNAAQIPLEQARDLEPDKSSIREALGRAYWHSGRYAEARAEFAAVVERYPVNDFAHFGLGRSLEKTGRLREAKRHLALATSLRPDRADYRHYRARLEAASSARISRANLRHARIRSASGRQVGMPRVGDLLPPQLGGVPHRLGRARA